VDPLDRLWLYSPFLFDSVGFTVEVEQLGMMQQSIQQSCGHHAVTHHLRPAIKALVGGDDDRLLFIKFTNQIEEQVRFLPVDGRIADFVDLC
jgi:hypothetical protein